MSSLASVVEGYRQVGTAVDKQDISGLLHGFCYTKESEQREINILLGKIHGLWPTSANSSESTVRIISSTSFCANSAHNGTYTCFFTS